MWKKKIEQAFAPEKVASDLAALGSKIQKEVDKVASSGEDRKTAKYTRDLPASSVQATTFALRKVGARVQAQHRAE